MPKPLIKRSWTKPTKYDESKHPEMVYSIFAQGGTRARICVEIGISDSTLQNWLLLNPALAEAYDQGVVACQMYWQDFVKDAVTDESINPQILRTVLIDRVGYTDKRKLRAEGIVGAKTKEERDKAMQNAIKGGVTTGELKDLTASSKDLQEMNVVDKMVEDVQNIKAQLADGNSKAQDTDTT